MPSVSMPMLTRVGVSPTVLLVKLAPVPIGADRPNTDQDPTSRPAKKSVLGPVIKVLPSTLLPVKSRGSPVVVGGEPATVFLSGRSMQAVGTSDCTTLGCAKGVEHSPIGSAARAAKAELPALTTVLPDTCERWVAGTLVWSQVGSAGPVGADVMLNAGVPPELTGTVGPWEKGVTNGCDT